MYSYKDIILESCSVVGEALNYECEIQNPQDLHAAGLRKYSTTVGHVYSYYVSSHASACYFSIRHGGVIEPTLTGLR